MVGDGRHGDQSRWVVLGFGVVAVSAPDDILQVVAKLALDGSAHPLVPHNDGTPCPPAELKGVSGCGKLAPVREHESVSTRPNYAQRLRRPNGDPPQPCPLVFVVATEGAILGSGLARSHTIHPLRPAAVLLVGRRYAVGSEHAP